MARPKKSIKQPPITLFYQAMLTMRCLRLRKIVPLFSQALDPNELFSGSD
jgi:hypothetical protein